MKKQLNKIKMKGLSPNFIKLVKGYLPFCHNEKEINKIKIKQLDLFEFIS